MGLVASFAVGFTLLAVPWRRRFRAGPLEVLLRPGWLVGERVGRVPEVTW